MLEPTKVTSAHARLNKDSRHVATADPFFSRHEPYALKDFVLILKTLELNRWKHKGVKFRGDQI